MLVALAVAGGRVKGATCLMCHASGMAMRMGTITPADLAARLLQRKPAGAPLVAGLTGPVAVGKTTLARQLAEALAGHAEVAIIGTDGFLKPNAVLEAEGLLNAKGFPPSYDRATLAMAVAGCRRGPITVPAYSHALYDIDPALARTVAPADIMLFEGLGLAPVPGQPALPLDCLIYVDAVEADVVAWFLGRFMALRAAAVDDPSSFYRQFLGLDDAAATGFARGVWDAINGPNWHQHIILARDVADMIVLKHGNHDLALVKG
jgi:type I pantothenate kinase